ncbi:helix-turn-helix domain-containing protein [Opitutus terrae]|uniref:Transcriptional regulator, XRE family n=1 Tax=Opitutus terrae (strain DSM 11246 / JCM 15787 / PB90-1) TaxID=452637 RepID=B1ZMM3_OPITP|nr:helix-turn-helix transcriptional regulator [Opitutus terrae]ACB74368.1 transcriptional regulator, XRE family [Opitutus terrae PB90-1]
MASKKDPRTPAQIKLAKQLGAAIAEARKKAGLSQDELAYRCGLHRAYMGFVEQGRYSITVATLVQVCSELDAKPSEILDEIGH